MLLVVVCERIQLSPAITEGAPLYRAIQKAGERFSSICQDNNFSMTLVEGVLPNSPENEKVVLLVSSTNLHSNMGQYIVDFKQEVLTAFANAGIQIDKTELLVRMSSPAEINRFIEHAKKRHAEEQNPKSTGTSDEFDYLQKSKQYIPVDPLYSFDRVILPGETLQKINEAVSILEYEDKVFNEWGLYEIQPHPSTSLSFFGPSGTGKTMAAEAIAQKLGKKILKVSYADVESKYHGEGPKMVKAIFLAATNNNAVLFFDEADSLLSKRLTNVSQGSEQAINSMRSQLLICLEDFRGIVIFATNLVVNYDQAFLTRLISIEFKNPDAETREKIWAVHIRPLDDGKKHILNIPLTDDVNIRELAEKYPFAGREIRNAVVSACVAAAMAGHNSVSQIDFLNACDNIVAEKEALEKSHNAAQESDIIKRALSEKIKKMQKGEQ